jgi:hypothetical protein
MFRRRPLDGVVPWRRWRLERSRDAVGAGKAEPAADAAE